MFDQMTVIEVCSQLRDRGFQLDGLSYRRGYFFAEIARLPDDNRAIRLGVEGRGETVEDALVDCLEAWESWRGVARG